MKLHLRANPPVQLIHAEAIAVEAHATVLQVKSAILQSNASLPAPHNAAVNPVVIQMVVGANAPAFAQRLAVHSRI
jgi:hypothetical protein